MPRLHCPASLAEGLELSLPPGAARHAQVLRLQPGDTLTLFNGEGGEWDAAVTRMGRSEVEVRVGTHHALEREAPRAVRLALGMPANERMDWLAEKAAELGAASIDPLMTARSVLRLSGERAAKKQSHWQAIVAAACEQCGRNRVPPVAPPRDFARWLAALRHTGPRLVLSLEPDARPLAQAAGAAGEVLLLSGPEGGLAPAELQAARDQGFLPVTLGPRVLRAETAPLAALVALTIG